MNNKRDIYLYKRNYCTFWEVVLKDQSYHLQWNLQIDYGFTYQ